MDVLRRIIGNALIVLGALNILNFYAPRPIPTVGFSAFIFGGLFIGAGILLRRKKDNSIGFRWRAALKKNAEPKTDADPLLAVRVLRLATENQGKLTVAQTAMELDVPLAAAEAALDECAAKGGAYIEVDPNSGIASYRFPEFLPPQN